MKTLEQIRKKVLQKKTRLIRQFKVKNLGVFGSYRRGDQNKKSDVDVLVEFSEPVGMFTFLDLEEELENELGVKVDLVSKKALKPRIGKRILQEIVYLI